MKRIKLLLFLILGYFSLFAQTAQDSVVVIGPDGLPLLTVIHDTTAMFAIHNGVWTKIRGVRFKDYITPKHLPEGTPFDGQGLEYDAAGDSMRYQSFAEWQVFQDSIAALRVDIGTGGGSQTLSFTNPNLSISGGNSIDLSSLSSGGSPHQFIYYNTVTDLQSDATTYDSTTYAFVEETKATYIYSPNDSKIGDEITNIGVINQSGKTGNWVVSTEKDNPEWYVVTSWGQSNMINRADTSSTIIETTDPRIYQMTRSGYSIVQATHPLDHWDDAPTNYGIAIDMVAPLLNVIPPNAKILIIPAAKGASHIAEHLKGAGTGYYEDLVTRLNRVLISPNYKNLAFLAHQGETDADNQDRIDRYIENFNLMLFQLKADVVNFGNPPVIVGGMSPTWLEGDVTGRFNGINNKLKAIPTTLYHHNAYFVPAKGCYELKDNIHFARSSSGRFASRYASVLLQKTFGSNQLPEKPILRVHQTATNAGELEWEFIYSPVPLTGINVYIGGVLNSTISNAINAATDSTYTVSGITISGVNITMSAVNENGEGPQSDPINITFSSTPPTPLHEYLCNEITGTTVTDTGTGGNNGTLSVDAVTVTSTLDGTNCFLFDRSQTISLGLPISFNPDDSYTIHFEVEADLDNSMVLGEQTTGYNYLFLAGGGEGLRYFPRYDNRAIPTTYLNTFHKYTLVVEDNYYRVYEDGVFLQKGHINTQFIVDTIGAGHSASSLNYSGKIKEVRIWNQVLNPTQVSNI